MGSEGQYGIIRAFFRWLLMWNWKKARQINQAADEQFTGSVEGIGVAYDMQHDTLVTRFKGLQNATSKLGAQLSLKSDKLKDLNLEEETLLVNREGAVSRAEKAKEAGNTVEYEKCLSFFNQYDKRINDIEAEQAQTEKELTEGQQTVDRLVLQLTELKRSIQDLDREKADEVGKFISNQQIIEINESLQGLQTSIDRGPIDAVRKANRDLSAKAKISDKIAGNDVAVLDKQFEEEGRKVASKDKMENILAARKAEKEAKQKGVVQNTEQERQKI